MRISVPPIKHSSYAVACMLKDVLGSRPRERVGVNEGFERMS
jgi:hypothetical protein